MSTFVGKGLGALKKKIKKKHWKHLLNKQHVDGIYERKSR